MQNTRKKKALTLILALLTCFMMCFGDVATVMATDQAPQAQNEASVAQEQENAEETANTNAEFVKNDADISKTEIAFETAYIAKHFNKDYVSSVDEDSLFAPVALARANATYTRKTAGDDYDLADTADNFIGAGEYSILIYDVDPESKYYAAIANANLADKDAKPYDISVIWNNYSGVELEDVYYDKDTSILYIAKDYIDNPDTAQVEEGTLAPVAIQTMYQWKEAYLEDGTADFGKHVPVIRMDYSNGDIEEKTLDVNNMFDVTTLIPSVVDDPADYSAEDFNIFLNGQFAAVAEDDYYYDKETGDITLAFPASTISSIMITVPHKGFLSKLASRFSINAASYFDKMKVLKFDGDPVEISADAASKLYVGWRGIYGKDEVSGKDTVYHASTKVLNKKKGHKESLKYMYRGESIHATWALVSYTKGVDMKNGNSLDKTEKVKKYNNSGKKKTIYEWFKSYSNNLDLFTKSTKMKSADAKSSGPYMFSYTDGSFQGTNVFALRFSRKINGKKNLISAGANKGKSNADINFGSDCVANSSYFLAACCRHFSNSAFSKKGKWEQLKKSDIWVSCLAKSDDYVVLCYAVDYGFGPSADNKTQEGYAIYKLKIPSEKPVEPTFKTNASKNDDDPGHVVVKDKVSYKRVTENGYEISSAVLYASNDVNVEPDPDIDDDDIVDWTDDGENEEFVSEQDGSDSDTSSETDNEDINIASGIVSVDPNAFSNATYYVVVEKENGTAVSSEAMDSEEYVIPVPDEVGKYTVKVYIDSVSGTPAATGSFTIKEDTDPDDEFDIDGKEKVTSMKEYSPAIKKHDKTDKTWYDTTVTMKPFDLGDYFKGPEDANKILKMGVTVKVTGPDKFKETLNGDLKDNKESMQFDCKFGWLDWKKVAEWNYGDKDPVVEEGARFQVYMIQDANGNKAFDSYDEAVADQAAKGYNTYKFAEATQTKNGLSWSNESGNLLPGVYQIVQTTAGNYYKSTTMAKPWKMQVTAKTVNKYPDPEIRDDSYEYDLTIQKISADKFETADENHADDKAYQHSALQNSETTFRIQSLNDPSTNSSEGYDETYNTTEETDSQITIHNIASGKYRISEEVVPTGYYMSSDDAYVDITIGLDMEGPKVTVDKIHQGKSGFTKIDVRTRNKVNKDGTRDEDEGGEETQEDSTIIEIVWVKSNIPQDTSLSVTKERKFTNEAGKEELEPFANVEFNLYADGDIIAYDGHGDHKYYEDGQIIQGMEIDEETGERHYFVDGEEITEDSYVPVYSEEDHYYKWQKADNIQKYRILTDNDGKWSSTEKSPNAKGTYIEYLGADSSTFPYYPLTNDGLIKVDGGEGTDGDSHYKLQEMRIWEKGAKISFTEDQKDYLRKLWVDNLEKDADEKIEGVGMSLNQILNHGIDITYERTEEADVHQNETMRYSSNGKYFDEEETVKNFIKNRLTAFLKEGNPEIVNKNNKLLGTIDWNAWVIDPDAEDLYDYKGTFDKFKVSPMDSSEEHNEHASSIINDGVAEIKTFAKNKDRDDQFYELDKETVTIVDTVKYKNLEPSREYTLTGTLMNANTGEAVMHNGEPVTATKKFTPKTRNGEEEVVFENVYVEDLEECSTVVFEKCEFGTRLIATHEDLKDEDQTVKPKPYMGTEASFDEDRVVKESLPSEEVTLYDTVEYHGLTVGKEYTITGYLYNADTMEPILKEGVTMKADADKIGEAATDKETGDVDLTKLSTLDDAVTAATTFTPDRPDGTVVVTFKFNAEGLQGTKIVTFEEEIPSRDKPDYLAHANIYDEPQITLIPDIGTVAKNDGIDMACADEVLTITDTVSYKNLEPNKLHKMEGVLMDKETGEPLEIDGETFKNTVEFTSSETGEGTVEVKFDIFTNGLEGKTLVAFEKCYDAEGSIVAVHEDIDDVPQTIIIPKVRTTAVDKATQTHIAEQSKEQTIIDTVHYNNLIGGRTYTVKGVLMNKKTKEPLKDNSGKEYRAEKEFTVPATEGVEEGEIDLVSGEVELEFKIDATKLEGTTAVVFEELYFEDVLVGKHKNIDDEDQTIVYPKVRTTAVDKLTGEHVGAFSGKDVVKDTVKMNGLIKGDTYTVKGTLMDKKTGKPIKVNGKAVTAEKTFIAGGEAVEEGAEIEYIDWTEVLEFKLDSTKLAGTTAVAFEELYYKNVLIGAHKNIKDKDQTVYYPEIRTKATASDGNKVVKAGKSVKVYDTVTYKNLVPGKKYVISGVLMDKATGKELKAGGKTVTASKSFTPKKSSGKVKIVFTLDASALNGKKAVAFETLTRKKVVVAEHKDIKDADQTVSFSKNPPKKTTVTKKPHPKTGDMNVPMWAIILFLAAAAALVGSVIYKRKKSNPNK